MFILHPQFLYDWEKIFMLNSFPVPKILLAYSPMEAFTEQVKFDKPKWYEMKIKHAQL